MSVTYYGPGDHDAGFIGFRVTKSWNGEYKQEYFSTLLAKSQSDSDPYYRYKRLLAEQQETKWKLESLEYQYQQFVTTTRGNTKPERGVGVHGIVAMFARYHGGTWEPCFCVSRPGKPQKRFMFKQMPFSEAWHRAVACWADAYSIMEDDVKRVTANPPEPEQFKRLRRQMNDHEGYDIPVECLSSVFREQREALKQTSLALKASQKIDLQEADLDAQLQVSATDILAWFENEQERAS